ncbi:MAG: phosphoribosylamine--glycine ligase [Spirochaetales bacterium]|nr:phosphoribosylamine--glycine ligase [Spirochaetales bacterium]
MKVLVLGSGAKDHALSWLFSKSKRLTGLFIAPGNAGTEKLGVNLATVDPSNPKAVLRACREHQIDYVFCGTEAPLAAGVVDVLLSEGISTFGAPLNSVRLEGDRSFAREFTTRYGIPIPKHHIAQTVDELIDFIENNSGKRLVIKRNGLAPSRVMIDSADQEYLLDFGERLLEKGEVLIEEHLKGMPLTVTILTDGEHYLRLPLCSDYIKAEEYDTGSATGGMGSICPVPLLDKKIEQIITNQIVEPTLKGLKKENLSYKGVLIFSLVLTENGPILVDYHVRFNDPATQAMAPLITTDFLDLLEAIQSRTIADIHLKISDYSSVAVVLASAGYPNTPEINKPVRLPTYAGSNMIFDRTITFFGAVDRENQVLHTTGGRCFTVVGIGMNILEANEAAYNVISEITFEGSWHRSDIGNKFFNN